MPFQRILVPVDFSDASIAAVDLASELARTMGAHVSLLHVGVFPHFASVELSMMGAAGPTLTRMSEEVAGKIEERLDALGQEHCGEGVEYSVTLREGYAPEEINAEVEEKGCDLVIMGTHGRTGMERVLLGSVADRVVRNSTVPVMVTHGGHRRGESSSS